MPTLLTRQKMRWSKQFKPKQLKGSALNPNASVSVRYYSRLADLIRRMTAVTTSDLTKFFEAPTQEAYFAEDASTASQARILTNALAKKFESLFNLHAKPIAESMVNQTDKASSSALHGSLKELSGGLSLPTTQLTGSLNEVLNATVTENVGLIKSIADQYLQGVQGAVMRAITSGNGLEDLIPYLQRHEGITLRRARMIANDQSRKAFSNLNKGRMNKLGIRKFEWLHSAGGVTPRPLHVSYNGKVFDLDNPPVIDERTGERGIPGQAINCRCRMVPVIEFDEG